MAHPPAPALVDPVTGATWQVRHRFPQGADAQVAIAAMHEPADQECLIALKDFHLGDIIYSEPSLAVASVGKPLAMLAPTLAVLPHDDLRIIRAFPRTSDAQNTFLRQLKQTTQELLGEVESKLVALKSSGATLSGLHAFAAEPPAVALLDAMLSFATNCRVTADGRFSAASACFVKTNHDCKPNVVVESSMADTPAGAPSRATFRYRALCEIHKGTELRFHYLPDLQLGNPDTIHTALFRLGFSRCLCKYSCLNPQDRILHDRMSARLKRLIDHQSQAARTAISNLPDVGKLDPMADLTRSSGDYWNR